MGATSTILVFDSGLGGLTVFDALAAQCPQATYAYVADDAAFPYGNWKAPALTARIMATMAVLVDAHRPDVVVVACNTASTLVLPPLRALWPDLPFVGTVPAIKPAAAKSRSKLVSVLGTPGTVARDYTRNLIAEHAAGCDVTLVGAAALATMAEREMRGGTVDDAAIAAQIAPCFVSRGERRTDAIALACTHYPLLLSRFERLAPWPVEWVDPAPAIARQAIRKLEERVPREVPLRDRPTAERMFFFTSGTTPEAALSVQLQRRRLTAADAGPLLGKAPTATVPASS